MTPDDNVRTLENWTELGAELGFRFDYFAGMKMVNTREAHVLLDYAKAFGEQTELQVRLFDAFFSERKDVSDQSVLAKEVQRVGLNVDDALARLGDAGAPERVRSQEAGWRNLGVRVLYLLWCSITPVR